MTNGAFVFFATIETVRVNGSMSFGVGRTGMTMTSAPETRSLRLSVSTPGVSTMATSASSTFFEDDALDYDRLFAVMNLLAERTGQTFNMANPILSVKLPGGHRAQFVAGQQNARQFTLGVRLANVREFDLTNYEMPDDGFLLP
jgi:hypothetical protein